MGQGANTFFSSPDNADLCGVVLRTRKEYRYCGKRSAREKISIISGKKVFYVNSYHPGYEWSDDITRAVLKTFGARMNGRGIIDNSDSKAILKMTYMDTKRNKSEGFKRAAALKVKRIIDSWHPDVVITSDDNAAKYLIVPYYLNSGLPFVFCGINLDASIYGFPASNVTGMVEVFLLQQAIDIIRKFAAGGRVCALAADTLSEHKNIDFSRKKFNINMKTEYLKTFHDLKGAYIRLQA